MKGILKGLGWFLVYFLLTALVQQVLAVLGAGADSLQTLNLYLENHMLAIAALSNLLTGLALVLLFSFRRPGIREQWRLCAFRGRDLLYAVILGFSYAMLSDLLTGNQASSMGQLLQKSAAYYGTPLGWILKAANLLLLAPVVEEIALRGIVYTRIRTGASAPTAIIISGLLFGLMHFMAGGAGLVISASLMGMLMGFLLYRYDSLYLCIAAHMAANLTDFLPGTTGLSSLPAVLLLTVLFAGAAIFCLVKMVKPRQ